MHMNGMFELHEVLASRDIPLEKLGIHPGMTAERIIVSGWVKIMVGKGYTDEEVPIYGPMEERLLVITNYQVYLLKHPYLTWKPCENCSPDKFCPRGPEFDSSIPFDRIQRVTYGFTGQWLHIGLSGAKGETSGRSSKSNPEPLVEERTSEDPAESIHIYCPRRRLCCQFCSAIKGACDDWERHNISNLGANSTYKYPRPDIDVDMAMRTAISSIIQFSRNSNSTNGHVNSKLPPAIDTKINDGISSIRRKGKGAEASGNSKIERYKEALLVTFVKVFKGAAGDLEKGKDFEDKLLILTKKHIIMADYDPKNWSFPINWSLRREMYLKKHGRKIQHLNDVIDRTEKEERQRELGQKKQKVR